MSDFVNKIVTVGLIFVLLVIAPLTISYMMNDMVAQRLVLNEVVQFIDKVTDKSSITQSDLDDLYIGVNATGGTYDVKVRRYVRLATEDEDGSVRTLYLAEEDMGKLNISDAVKVTVEEVGLSPAKRLLWALLNLDSGKFEFSLTGTVR